MFNTVILVFFAVASAVAAAEVEANGQKGQGATKKAKAVDYTQKALDSILPDSLNPIIHALTPGLIEILVSLMTNSGFFKRLFDMLNGISNSSSSMLVPGKP